MAPRIARPPERPERKVQAPLVLDEAGRLGARPLAQLLAWQALRTGARLAFAGSLSLLVGRMIADSDADIRWAGAALLALVLAAAAGFMADGTQAVAETRVAAGLRTLVRGRLAAMPASTVRSLVPGHVLVSVQRHPEAVAALVVGHRAAGRMMALGPLLAAAFLFAISWQAALLVIALTPVMIVFFVLVGGAIRARVEAQEKAFGRLAGQFADRVRTLPTILANHALGTEETKLRRRMEAYAENTMSVLRIAFLNAGVIDFFASLAIAILAVLLGLGHLGLVALPGFSNLELWQSLFILTIAPECFAPFRRFAEAYHAKAEGQAAAVALDCILDAPAPAVPVPPSVENALDELRLPSRGIVAICGPSGSGKSMLLRRLAGLEGGGVTRAVAQTGIAWIGTDSFIPAGTLGQAIAWNCASVCPTRLLLAASRVRLLDDALLPGGLEARIDEGGRNLSGGQRLRIVIARALLTDKAVFADEPTAKLDARIAGAVRQLLCELALTRMVVAATHDEKLRDLASDQVDLGREAQPDRELQA